MTPPLTLLLSLSIILQALAAYYALRLIWLTGYRLAWTLIASATVLMAVRRGISLVAALAASPHPPDPTAEVIAILISALIALGMAQVAPIFIERRREEESHRQQEADMKEAQRLAHIGSWEWDAAADTIRWSDEYYRIYGLDPTKPPPDYKTHLAAYTSESAARLNSAVKQAMATGAPYELDLELARPTAETRWIVARGEARREASGRVVGLRGTAQNITERRLAEQERLHHLAFFENMDRINRAIQKADTPEGMMREVLDLTLSVFGADRVFLLYPCDPASPTWTVPMERTRPEYPGVFSQGITMSTDPQVAETFRVLLASDGPVCFGPDAPQPLPAGVAKRFSIRAILATALFPRSGSAWQFGLHQCSGERHWSPDEQRLFKEISRRLADGLTSLLNQRDLRENEHFLDSIVEHIPNMLFVKDAEQLRFVRFNRAGEQLLGYDRAELLGKSDHDFFPPEIAEFFVGKDREVLATKGAVDIPEERIQTREHGERLLHTRKIPILDETGNPRFLLGISEDITERRTMETALKRSEEFNRDLLATVDEGFIVIDRDYRLLSVNRAFCEMMQCQPTQVVGRSCYAVSHQADRPCHEFGEECPVRQTFEDGRPHSVTHIHRNAAGEERHVELKSYPITRADGTIQAVIEAINDVTEKMRLEGQLLQAQKMEAIGRLAGGVAHDFNNMLSVILGHAEMGLMKLGEPGHPLYSNLQEIRKAASRSADLTRQLLAFARKQTVAPKRLDLNVTVEGMLKMLRRLIGENIELIWRPGQALWPILIDPSQIDQILANLCVNARDAIVGTGTLGIETHNVTIDPAYCADHPEASPGDYLLLTVSDDGCGMDRETLDRIFEPFFTTKEKDKGTGLGLATVYGIVRQNSGFINVYSEQGHGSTFRIYLPRHPDTGGEQSEDAFETSPATGHETILLVEDEPVILEMTRLMLADLGYRVLSAASVEEAMRLAGEQGAAIDLLLTDVIMPQMTGPDLARNLRALAPQCRTLFMSGYTCNVIVHHGVLDPGVNFIQKPFTIRGLAAMVRQALEGGETGEQACE